MSSNTLINAKSITDRFEWFKAIGDISWNKYGGELRTQPDVDYNNGHRIEYSLVSAELHPIKPEDVSNGLVRYYQVRIWESDSTTDLTDALAETYLERIASLVIYNTANLKGVRDKKQVEIKGPSRLYLISFNF